MLYGLSRILTVLFDALTTPFGAHRFAALVFVSALFGVGMIFLFRATSDQTRIHRARDVFKARVLEMRIYQDHLGLIFRALGAALASNALYLRASGKPIVLLALLVGLVWGQLEGRFATRGLAAGETTVLTVQLKSGLDVAGIAIDAVAEDGIAVEAGPVRVSRDREVCYRLRKAGDLDGSVVVSVIGKTYRLPVAGMATRTPAAGHRDTGARLDALLHPLLPSIPPDSPIQRIELKYPGKSYRLAGLRLHWLVVFAVASLLGALIPKFLFRIEI